MKTLAIRFDDELHARLTMLSKLSGSSVTETIHSAVDAHLTVLAKDPEITARAQELTVEIDKEAAQQRNALAALLGATEKPASTTPARGRRSAKE